MRKPGRLLVLVLAGFPLFLTHLMRCIGKHTGTLCTSQTKMVLAIFKKIDDERQEIENKLTVDQKRNIEKEKAERVAKEKKQEEFRLRKRKNH